MMSNGCVETINNSLNKNKNEKVFCNLLLDTLKKIT